MNLTSNNKLLVKIYMYVYTTKLYTNDVVVCIIHKSKFITYTLKNNNIL